MNEVIDGVHENGPHFVTDDRGRLPLPPGERYQSCRSGRWLCRGKACNWRLQTAIRHPLLIFKGAWTASTATLWFFREIKRKPRPSRTSLPGGKGRKLPPM